MARAEQAVEVLSEEFVDWINEDIVRLQSAHDALTGNSDDPRQAMDNIFNVAHDMRGQGAVSAFHSSPVSDRPYAAISKGATGQLRQPMFRLLVHILVR